MMVLKQFKGSRAYLASRNHACVHHAGLAFARLAGSCIAAVTVLDLLEAVDDGRHQLGFLLLIK
jgi:hypothetical protein